MNKPETRDAGVVESINRFGRHIGVNTYNERNVRKGMEGGRGETGGDVWGWC
jgi:hypothetical protein